MQKLISHSLEETQKIAHDWLGDISNKYKDTDKAVIVGLSGHLGAGKTAFVKAVAKELGIKETVTSPTFVLMKIYLLEERRIPQAHRKPQGNWKRLIHIDAYRLERPEDLAVLNFDQIIADKDNLIMIEWPENVGLEPGGCTSRLGFEVKDGEYEITSFLV